MNKCAAVPLHIITVFPTFASLLSRCRFCIKIIHLSSAVADDACRSFNMENLAEETLQSMGRESRFEREANVWSENEERRARSSSYLQPWRFGVPIAGRDRDFGYVGDSLRERETEHSP